MWHLLWLLLPVASGSGWYFGRKSAKQPAQSRTRRGVPVDYLMGVNYLINEQPDRAVDIFIRMLEVDGDTVETHLALGSLFRRRGEVDRAIRIHQNIIARPQLDKSQRVMALTELGKDYLKAGVLDRAERIFQELVSLGEEMQSSLEYLLHIYEQQKDWQQAIHAAQKLNAISKENRSTIIAQYYCEMAEVEFSHGHEDQALHYLKRATSVEKSCIRVCLLQAEIHMSRHEYQSAIKSLERIALLNPDYICETIEPLRICYDALDKMDHFIHRMHDWLLKYPRMSIMLVLTDYIIQSEGERVAIDFLAEQLRKYPSLRGLQRLIELYLHNSDGDARTKLQLLGGIVNELLKDKPKHRCGHCGFGGHDLYWQCPGCRRWGSVKPIHGIEGD